MGETHITLKLLQVPYSGKPATAQNDAMMAAYHDNMTYFYRVNDDTTFVTGDWARIFIKQLNNLSPFGLGVVGPSHHGDRANILTYDFVHRTHIDVHGFYYPPELTDWYADGWITCKYLLKIYQNSEFLFTDYCLCYERRLSYVNNDFIMFIPI